MTTQGSGVRRRMSLRSRLVLGNLAVVGLAVAVTWAVATLEGPALFRAHVDDGAQGPLDPGTLDRVEQAFHVANLLQVLLVTAVAVLLTLAVSLLVARAVARSVNAMAAAAADVAAGNYRSQVPARQVTPELDTLAHAINDLGRQVAGTEAVRRRMLTDLAHELRTPLATLDAYLEAIEDGVETADEDTLALLRAQLRRITRLADDVNAVSAADERRLAVHLAPTALGQVVRESVEAARPRYAGKGVALETRLEPGDDRVAADAERLGQVLINLLTNALRHTPTDGRVVVTTTTDTDAARVTVEVSDDGEGIAAEHLPHVFERFYRAHRAPHQDDQGSGVGLTISRTIVAAHSGALTLESPGPGRGTTARVTLPLATLRQPR